LSPVLDPAAAGLVDAAGWLLHLPVYAFQAYGSLLRAATHAVRDLFDSYGYWVVFLGTLFENTLFLGTIIPGVLILLLAGISAGNGDMSPFIAAGLAFAGCVIGDTVSYLMGRYGWSRVTAGGTVHQFMERVREPIMRRGPAFVMLYHFAGYTRLLGPAGAGMLRMPYRRWAPADHFGAFLWVGSHVAIGYGLGVAGVSFDTTDKYFKVIEWLLLAFVILWFVFLYRAGWQKLRDHMFMEEEEVEEEPETVPT
jgi:membrane-associated protein